MRMQIWDQYRIANSKFPRYTEKSSRRLNIKPINIVVPETAYNNKQDTLSTPRQKTKQARPIKRNYLQKQRRPTPQSTEAGGKIRIGDRPWKNYDERVRRNTLHDTEAGLTALALYLGGRSIAPKAGAGYRAYKRLSYVRKAYQKSPWKGSSGKFGNV